METNQRPKGERESAPIAELVPWLMQISSGQVVCKDSGLLACFRIDGFDWSSKSPEEIDALLARWAAGITALQHDPIAIWSHSSRFEYDSYPHSSFANPVAAKIDEEHHHYIRSAAGQRHALFVSFYLGPIRGASGYIERIKSLTVEGESLPSAIWFATRALFNSKYAFAYTASELYAASQRFEQLIDGFVSRVSELGWHRLEDEELMGFLGSFVSDSRSPIDRVRVSHQLFLDTELPDAVLADEHPKALRLGNKWISLLSIKEWDVMTHPELMLLALSVNAPVRISTAYRIYTPEASKRIMSRMRNYLQISSYSVKDYLKAAFSKNGLDPERENTAKAAEADEIQEALSSVSKRAWGMMNITLQVEASSLDEVLEKTDELRKRLLEYIPGVIWEDLYKQDAWATQLPGQLDQTSRWLFMNAENFADSVSAYTVNTGSERNDYLSDETGQECPALTQLATGDHVPFNFNFHVGALAHAMLIGPSRSGKSVFMGFLIAQWQRYAPSRTVVFDKDWSCKIITYMLDGEHFDLTRSRVPLNPLKLVSDPQHHEFLLNWIIALIQSRGYNVTSEDENAIQHALQSLESDNNPEHHRLSSLRSLLPPKLHPHIDRWIDDGPYAKYFDNLEDHFSLGSVTTFEMGEILRSPIVAGAFIEYAFYRISRMIEENRKGERDVVPTMIYLEECWFLFEHPAFEKRIRDWLKTLAKLNAFVVMATQSMEDMVANDRKVFASIRDNIPTTIYLPNPKARTDSLRRLYVQEFGLPERLIDAIAFARPRMDYLIISGENEHMVSCEFSSRQLAFLRSDSLALSIFDEEYQKGEGWRERYLNRILKEG